MLIKHCQCLPGEELPIEFALLNYSKLESIVRLGCLEQAIMLIKKDILPLLTQFVLGNKTISGLTTGDINYIADSELLLVKALAIQGSKEAVKLANDLVNKASRLSMFEIEIEAKLMLALFYTLQGDIKPVDNILDMLKMLLPR